MSETITLTQVYSEIKKMEKQMVTRHELVGILETMDILSNPNTMRQLRQSEEDIRMGRTRPVKSVKDLLCEC